MQDGYSEIFSRRTQWYATWHWNRETLHGSTPFSTYWTNVFHKFVVLMFSQINGAPSDIQDFPIWWNPHVKREFELLLFASFRRSSFNFFDLWIAMATEPPKKKRKQQHNVETGEEEGKTTARALSREQNARDPTMMPKVHKRFGSFDLIVYRKDSTGKERTLMFSRIILLTSKWSLLPLTNIESCKSVRHGLVASFLWNSLEREESHNSRRRLRIWWTALLPICTISWYLDVGNGNPYSSHRVCASKDFSTASAKRTKREFRSLPKYQCSARQRSKISSQFLCQGSGTTSYETCCD